jgi:hypothetical protein
MSATACQQGEHMEIPKDSEVGLRLAAMSAAISDVMASVAVDVLIFRRILADRDVVSDAEYETAIEAFEQRLGKALRTDIAKQVCDGRNSALEGLNRGPVN